LDAKLGAAGRERRSSSSKAGLLLYSFSLYLTRPDRTIWFRCLLKVSAEVLPAKFLFGLYERAIDVSLGRVALHISPKSKPSSG
jgi:hypothetical protein